MKARSKGCLFPVTTKWKNKEMETEKTPVEPATRLLRLVTEPECGNQERLRQRKNFGTGYLLPGTPRCRGLYSRQLRKLSGGVTKRR